MHSGLYPYKQQEPGVWLSGLRFIQPQSLNFIKTSVYGDQTEKQQFISLFKLTCRLQFNKKGFYRVTIQIHGNEVFLKVKVAFLMSFSGHPFHPCLTGS